MIIFGVLFAIEAATTISCAVIVAVNMSSKNLQFLLKTYVH